MRNSIRKFIFANFVLTAICVMAASAWAKDAVVASVTTPMTPANPIISLCPWLWWKFDSSVSEPGIFLSQLPYNERPQIQPRLEHPPSRCFQR